MACDATGAGNANGDVAAQTPSGLARAIGQTGDLARAEAAITHVGGRSKFASR